jgi:peptidoglycan hydrolase CwlO-like protein
MHRKEGLMKIIISVVSFLIAVGAAYVAVDQRYAHAEEVKKLEMRLEQKILEDRSQSIQERIWRYEDRAEKTRSQAPELADAMRRLQMEKTSIDSQIKIINEKVITK